MVCGRRRLCRVVRRAWAWRGVPGLHQGPCQRDARTRLSHFQGHPPHTHTPRRQSPAFREGGTHPESAPALAERAPLPDPGSAPPSSSADFTDSLSLPHVTVCKGPCSGDDVTCVSRFRLIRSCWTRGKTLQSWVGGSSRGLPRLQVPGGASISRSPQPFTGSQDGAETFANNGKAVCRPASERVCFCLW